MRQGDFGQRGAMLLGFVIGLVVGLAVAVAVALYIGNAPLPFVTKVRPPSTVPAAPADGRLPDPNKALNLAPPAAAPAPGAPAAAPPPAKMEAAPASPEAAAARQEALPEGSRFLLQAGAFKSSEDADGMRAQLAMLGLDARIFPIEQGGQTLYRVRLGPYGQLDDVNRVRKLLADNSIEAQIVRIR
ncbi:MAG: SPOR domain-containing protein [Burkholderiaceae bacterium]|jgi:cell division protein FtsN|nr:SPOR domain-containing protein [Burkholderiaceae bacterium]